MTISEIKPVHCPEISPQQFNILKRGGNNFQLLDVRQPEEYAQGNLQGTLIPLSQLTARISELNPTSLTIVYCQHGVRSQQAAAILLANGFKNVKSLIGGYAAWLENEKEHK